MSAEQAPFALTDTLRARIDRATAAVSSRETAKRALSLLDFTSLNDDDTPERIKAFCHRATSPEGHVAAVCLYPQFVAVARKALVGTGVKVASVANFPQGGADPEKAARETREAIDEGSEEIDIVYPYRAHLAGDLAIGREVVAACRKVCGSDVPLKVILETSQLPDAETVAAISDIAIAEGADFIKTSTGKIGGGATLEAAAIMLDAIRRSGRAAGLKPSGGIKDTAQAARYLALADDMMGSAWATPATFRIGASGIMTDLRSMLGLPENDAVKPPAGSY